MADDQLVFETFEPLVGTDFVVAVDGEPVALNLVEATPFANSAALARAPFGLLFQSGIQQVIPQQLFPLRHETLGELEIFLVPTAQNPTGIQYYATFN
jgi:hypothetical protein